MDETEWKAAFDMFDEDGSDAIDEEELFGALEQMGMDISKEKCKKIIAKYDVKGEGEIDFAAFVKLMRILIGGGDPVAEEEEEEADLN